MENEKVFDRSKPITIKIMSGGVKACKVRYPTDEEWCARTRRQKIVRRQVTGGKFMTDVLNIETADADLLRKIRLDPEGVEFTDAEASKVISKLEESEIGDVVQEGDRFQIELITKLGKFLHVVKIPTEDAARRFSRASSHPISGRKLEETTVSLEPSGEFYDTVHVRTEGYADPTAIPIIHKDVVVVELQYQVRKIEEELDPEV